MTKKLLVRAIAALLLHCQPAIGDLVAPPHARLAHLSVPAPSFKVPTELTFTVRLNGQ